MRSRQRLLATSVTAAALLPLAACGGSGSGANSNSGASGSGFTIGVIEQQLTNPFFDTLEKAAKDEATKNGLKVVTAEAKSAGDSATQVAAIEDMVNRGVKGIVIDPANASAVVSAIKQARAKKILVIAVNTQTDPVDAVDATIETDNLQAGKLIGQWAKATLGDKAPRVAMLDYDLSDRTANQRHQGFLQGFGITDNSPQIAGTALTKANVDTGKSSMENLLQAHPDINAVYSINEPAAEGAFAAIKARNLQGQIALTGIDGSCGGVQAVKDGQIGATVAQFPKKMGQMAVDDIIAYVKNGTKPSGVIDSGTTLITDKPVPGVESKDTTWGLQNCWG